MIPELFNSRNMHFFIRRMNACPQVITDCMMRLLQDETPAALHAYTASAGSMEARAAVAAYFRITVVIGDEQ